MRLRITVRKEEPVTVVEVHGELLIAGLRELDAACDRRLELVIDLSNVRQVDTPSVAWLRELAADGVKLVGASPYVAMLLESMRSDGRHRRLCQRGRWLCDGLRWSLRDVRR